jgi:steroid 5-alpha reductase family enzyme
MFLFVSIPLIETRHLERRPGYEERARKVSLLVPWFPKA